MKTFETGKTYTCRMIGDSNLVVTGTVLSRTAKTVTMLVDNRGQKTFRPNSRLYKDEGAECVFPYGNYSMCPILVSR